MNRPTYPFEIKSNGKIFRYYGSMFYNKKYLDSSIALLKRQGYQYRVKRKGEIYILYVR